MVLDVIFLIAIAFAIFKGFSRGLVVSALSFVAYYIGIAAALKLSASVAAYLSKGESPSVWLPALSFVLVFIAVVIIVHLLAKAIRSVLRIGQLGIFDRIGGIAFYLLIYLFIFSILIFYGEKLNLINEQIRESSFTYRFVSPIAPALVSYLGEIIPVFSNLFEQLKDYFGNFSK